jgi:hypothetical protein
MSNTTTYIGFSSIDYKGVDSLSSYAIPLTPLKFVINSNEIDEHKRAVWDFGDGTVSKSISASKYFEFPGVYEVNLILYDCNNNALISTQTKTITIYDYLAFTFNITLGEYLVTEDGDYILDELRNYILIDVPDIVLKCGEIYGPIYINSYYPIYQPASNLYYSFSGSNSENYWNLPSNKFNHLERYYSAFETVYNYAISSYQYVEIDKITPDVVEIYAKVKNNSIVYCDSEDEGAEFIGLSGSKAIYLKDDSISDKMNFKIWFDKTNNVIPNVASSNHLNNLGLTLKTSVIDNPANRLSITSNGLDGEGYTIDSFNIDKIKLFDSKIPFIVKIKDVNNFSIKNFEKIPLSALSFTVDYVANNVSIVDNSYVYTTNTPSISDYTIGDLNYTMLENSGGYFRGYIIFPLSSYDFMSNVSISVSSTLTSYQLSTYSLSCQSNTFNVYKKNFYDIWIKNEDFDSEQTLMDLRFQETLLDKNVLFEDFLGGILGDANAIHDDIGIKTYEKIANFVTNTQDLDSCEQECIDSIGDYTGYNNSIGDVYQYPDSIKRWMRLASMDKSKLVGELNTFRENFDIRGRTKKDLYGINIGNKIDTTTYVVSAGTPIVALEKFGNVYTMLNTFQPISAVGSRTYKLSAYSPDWGWPLVLPTSFNFSDIEKYYLFFNYVDQYDNTSVGGLIDFENPKTTVLNTASYGDLFGTNGIFDTIFISSLYQSLSLV